MVVPGEFMASVVTRIRPHPLARIPRNQAASTLGHRCEFRAESSHRPRSHEVSTKTEEVGFKPAGRLSPTTVFKTVIEAGQPPLRQNWPTARSGMRQFISRDPINRSGSARFRLR